MMRRAVILVSLVVCAVLFAAMSGPVRASDHADPSDLTDPYSNITGLFIFPKGDRYILIFNVRRALTIPKPYPLRAYDYVVNFDLSTPVIFNSAEDRARYGGTIVTPEKIHADASITIKLNDDTTLNSVKFDGLKNTGDIRVFTGVRDDPFIFPRFFGVNVISMVMSIPMNAFPDGQRDYLLWGTTWKDKKMLDHVGRSVRSQLPRFGILNTTEPKEHVQALMKVKTFWDDIYNFFKGNKEWYSKSVADLIEFTFLIRKYDLVPDVMIYTNRFPPGYPNGRQVADDVNAITCAVGDCLLQELSFIEGNWPRATTNDKPFLADWPYLAEPWPDKPEPAPSTRSILPYVIGIALVVIVLSWVLVEVLIWLFRWLLALIRRKKAVPA